VGDLKFDRIGGRRNGAGADKRSRGEQFGGEFHDFLLPGSKSL
jgi:hypothetical protein